MTLLNYCYAVAVIHEIADKVFDLHTTISYRNEKLFCHPKDSVYRGTENPQSFQSVLKLRDLI